MRASLKEKHTILDFFFGNCVPDKDLWAFIPAKKTIIFSQKKKNSYSGLSRAHKILFWILWYTPPPVVGPHPENCKLGPLELPGGGGSHRGIFIITKKACFFGELWLWNFLRLNSELKSQKKNGQKYLCRPQKLWGAFPPSFPSPPPFFF